jgi:hypothetical protein
VEKLVYLVWDRPSRDPDSIKSQFLDDIARRLLDTGAHSVTMHLDDADAQVPTMVPVPEDELPVRAAVSVWVDNHDTRGDIEAILGETGIRRAGYLVTESLYKDYGDNEHAQPRDWPDGQRSPGIVMLTIFDKPPGMDDDQFYGHWYGHQSPMSEWMQPRARYVRNAVVRSMTPGAPRYKAIVAESWASAALLTDITAFFGSADGKDVAELIRIMLDSTKLLFDPATMRSYTLSEYIVRS